MTLKKKLSLRMIEDLRSKIIDLEVWISKNKARLTETKFDMVKVDANCELCDSPMPVQKTVTRKIVTLLHNQFNARERVLVCQRGCKQPDGKRVTRRDQTLASLVPAGANYGYDVEVFIGVERFIHHRQREEIRSALMEKYAISISSSEVSVLARRFLTHLEALHKHRADKIRDIIRQDGGYTMHVDATTEGGRGTLLVILSGWRQWVLGAWKIPSESEKAIEPCITEICRLFGEPCAIMRDLGAPVASAIELAASKMTVRPKILACHYHFLRDVGKGLLDDGYERLRKYARKFSVRANIRGVVTTLRKKAEPELFAFAKQHFNELHSCGGFPNLPQGDCGISMIIFLAQWVLDYVHDSRNTMFPFGHPYHDLYKRCLAANNAIDEFLSHTRYDHTVDKALEKLKKTLLPFVSDKDVRKTVREFERRVELFDKFRALFRIDSEMPECVLSNSSHTQDAAALSVSNAQIKAFDRFESDMKRQVDAFKTKLENIQNASSTKKDTDMKVAAKIITDHLKRHNKFLWGHILALGDKDNIKFRIVDRTNNVLENLFHRMKHRERRRSGRKILTNDFETIPPAAALAINLSDSDYLQAVCGTLDDLPLWFSKIDHLCSKNPGSVADANFAWFSVDENIISMTEKMFVRRQKVHDWVLAASQGKNIDDLHSTNTTHSPLAPFQEIDSFLEKSSRLHPLLCNF
jgi:hypothetical protein